MVIVFILPCRQVLASRVSTAVHKLVNMDTAPMKPMMFPSPKCALNTHRLKTGVDLKPLKSTHQAPRITNLFLRRIYSFRNIKILRGASYSAA
uniref:Putative secreted protein n=1 Tax=Ixodes ricinus TaxID=34613 RepID=A0A6B0U4V9_IXORI